MVGAGRAAGGVRSGSVGERPPHRDAAAQPACAWCGRAGAKFFPKSRPTATSRTPDWGKAITYLLRHWRPLTLFLRQAGAPLDNNIVESALKRAVLHRKNALFYRTLHGAEVGDLFMSLIHTCQLCGTHSFDYLIELHATLRNWPPNPRNGCPGTIARHWRGLAENVPSRPAATTSERLFPVDHGIARKRCADSAAEGHGKGPDQRTCAGRVRLVAQIRPEGLVSDQANSSSHADSD